MSGGGDDGFLKRWSGRKAASREGEHDTSSPEPTMPPGGDDRSDAEILHALGLPDPETLDAGANFAAFMAQGVPERIRRRALRRLWRSNPVLHNLDGLVDHGEDYTGRTTRRADLRTAYKVGRGILRHVEKPVASEAAPDMGLRDKRSHDEARRAGMPDEPASDAPPSDPVEVPERRPQRMKFVLGDASERNERKIKEV